MRCHHHVVAREDLLTGLTFAAPQDRERDVHEEDGGLRGRSETGLPLLFQMCNRT